MRIPAFCLAFLLFPLSMTFCTDASPVISLEAAGESGGIYRCIVSYKTNGFMRKIPLYIVNSGEKDARNLVLILHGYKPAGDPYRQDPVIIISNWGLAELAPAVHDVFLLPDMGKTVYPLYKQGCGAPSDTAVLKDIFIYFGRKFAGAGIIFAGISTGAEGAVKIASCFGGPLKAVCLSGTFDYTLLKPQEGEYRIHEEFFGTNKDVWERENPLTVLKTMKKKELYIFSEENSIYDAQAGALIDAGLANIAVLDKRNLGKGFNHSWKFWKSRAVLSELSSIFR